MSRETIIQDLRARIDRSPRTSNGKRRFSGELKADIVAALDKHGITTEAGAKLFAISTSILWQWRKKAPPPKNPRFERVAIEAAPVAAAGTCGMLRLTTSTGIEVQGLSVADVVAILRQVAS